MVIIIVIIIIMIIILFSNISKVLVLAMHY